MSAQVALSIFAKESFPISDEIYLSGIKDELKEIVLFFDGLNKFCQFFKLKYSRVKEWVSGRKPIPLSELKRVLSFLPKKTVKRLRFQIDSKDFILSCRYSPQKILFPEIVSLELAYLVGLVLGDGSLRGESLNKSGNWGVLVFFDNLEHSNYYSKIVFGLFGIKTKTFFKDGCYCNYFHSKVVHWFLRNFFEIKNGLKCDKIIIPQIIANSNNKQLISACLMGLFDSDGTVVVSNKNAKFASTSRQIVEQTQYFLKIFGIKSKFSVWNKNEKSKPLYTVAISGKEDILRFACTIGFKHPVKSEKLGQITGCKKYSPMV